MPRISVRRPSPALVIAVIALFIAASGGAMAAQSGSSGPGPGIAAAKKKKKKPKSTRGPRGRRGPQGLRGATGPAGAPGAQGAQGPPGPSQAFEAHNQGPITGADDADTIVATLAGLPPGAYFITAKANITRLTPSGGSGVGMCTLKAEGDADGSNTVLPGISIGAVVFTELTHTFPNGGIANLACSATQGTSWAASQIKIVAVKVGSESKVAVTS